MFSKVELELKKKPEPGKTAAESTGMKNSPDDVLATLRNPSTNKPVKQLLQYRGKRSISNWDSSDSGSSSHYDETEQCSQGAESTTSDFFSGSDHACEVDLRSDTSSSPNQETPTAFASGLRSPQQAFQPTKQYRYCWYCYDVYSAMCLAQGKATPDIHSRGIWRGHCMKDAQGVTTCPHLWFTTCGHCGATADTAHSPEFCPVAKLASLNFQEN